MAPTTAAQLAALHVTSPWLCVTATAPAPCLLRSGVTIEYQRQQAKAMRQYFQNLKLTETVEKSK